ncbi:TetR/AcrR family transcriptional regulator [Phenylobacterium sp.]|jgi:AcrR family transcriptional regulator|uniref:TetR/AcrR family transcriptional regulator n=1 Tax=Phenylobacterium sp. TaxID=1871053 RepID=UPI002F945E0E
MVQNEPRRRGRPRSFDEGQVLEKARGVFWNLGYAATSLDDLAAATGLNRPSLYAAFGDKHALYIRALKESRDAGLAGMRQVFGAELSLRDALKMLFAGAIAAYMKGDIGQRGCFIIGTAVTQSVEDAEARALVAGFVSEMDAIFLERFERAQNELAPGVAPAQAAAMGTATLHTLAIRARTGDDHPALKRVAAAAVDIICGPA